MNPKQQMLNTLDDLIAQGKSLHQRFRNDLRSWTADFLVWVKASELAVETFFGTQSDSYLNFARIHYMTPASQTFANDQEKERSDLLWFDSGLLYAISVLIAYRYSIEKIMPDTTQLSNPNIFISHGGTTMTHVDGVSELLKSIGLNPIVVYKMPSFDLSLNQKVHFYANLCGAAIVLATAEDEIVAAKEKWARPNVENEIGILQAKNNIGGKIVYMKEGEVKFASNYAEKVWIPFTKRYVQISFTDLLRELTAFGIIGRK